MRCLVLGGSGYVGSEVCRALHAQGARVAFTYKDNAQAANKLAAELEGSRALRVDLASFAAVGEAVDAIAREWDGLDALVQCAGTAGDPALYRNGAAGAQRLLGVSEQGWREMIDITVGSTFAACQSAVRAMGERGGHIVVIGSMDGVKSVPAPVHYAAGKGALRAMVQALAKELGKRRILVNMIAPGILEGGMGTLLGEELLAEYVKHCSLKRTGTAREVADFVAWLVAENTYVTGQSILLDGGL